MPASLGLAIHFAESRLLYVLRCRCWSKTAANMAPLKAFLIVSGMAFINIAVAVGEKARCLREDQGPINLLDTIVGTANPQTIEIADGAD